MLSIDPIVPQDKARLMTSHRIGAFAAGILICSLVLQRFAIPVGTNGVDVVFPIGFLFALIAMLQGTLTLHRGRFTTFLLFVAWLFIGAFVQAVAPNSYAVPYSLSSALQFLLLTSFCTLSFSVPISEIEFCRQGVNILATIAAAGIAQFLAQIMGLNLFSFSKFLPPRMLFETGYNLVIPSGIGSLMKSNGFFLLEPSIFSQAMAMALIIEMLAARRAIYLIVFTIALVLSFSGTGWIIMASFLLTIGITQGSRGVAIALIGTTVFVISAFSVFILMPDFAQVFVNRLSETNQVGTSGYLRFVTPFKLLYTVFSHNSWAWLTGIGAGVSERIDLPFSFGVNTPVKIAVEYGIPGLFLYVMLILRSERTPLQRALLLPSMTFLFITGGYQEFAPVLFPVFLLICIARLESPKRTKSYTKSLNP